MGKRRLSLADDLALAAEMGVSSEMLAQAIQAVLKEHVDSLIKRSLADDFYKNQNGFNRELRKSSLGSIDQIFNAMVTNLAVHDYDYSGVSAQTICDQILKRSKSLQPISHESAIILINDRLKYLETSGSITKLPNGHYMIPLEQLYHKALQKAHTNDIRLEIKKR